MIDRKRLREMGVPEDMTADDVKALFSLSGDDDRMHQQRRYILSGGLCVTCSQHMASEMMPPHDASPRCESGKRNHCSCDVCF